MVHHTQQIIGFGERLKESYINSLLFFFRRSSFPFFCCPTIPNFFYHPQQPPPQKNFRRLSPTGPTLTGGPHHRMIQKYPPTLPHHHLTYGFTRPPSRRSSIDRPPVGFLFYSLRRASRLRSLSKI